MYRKEYIAERKFVGETEVIRHEFRRAKLFDFIPAIWLFIGIVWRKWDEGYRLSANTAWSVATGVHGLEKISK